MAVTLYGGDTTNLVFGEGFLFATVGSELTNGQPLGKLQELMFDDALDFQKFYGPGAQTALAAGAGQATVGFSAKSGAMRPNGFRALRGGTLTEAAGKTTWKRLPASRPDALDLHLKTPSDGTDLEVKLYECICNRVSWGVTDKGFTLKDYAGEALGNSTDGVMQCIFPGNMMVS